MSVLSWNQIHANAVQFVEEWADAVNERSETQTFYNEFFEIFGVRRSTVAVYERKISKIDTKNAGFIDLFWPGMLIVEQKSAGRNLDKAATQADDYILALKEQERPRYRLVCDFKTFILADLETREQWSFTLEELPDYIRHFGFIAGRREIKFRDQDPVNIDASEKMSNMHKVLEETGYKGADLERFLVRIMFCLFADDTGIFEQDLFLRYVEDRTAEDGSDVGTKLNQLFEILNTPYNDRYSTLDEDLAAFPYVNGGLFSDLIRTPSFNAEMREVLLECCYFNWSKVSPALFGSLFQTVMLPEEQRKEGAHYTSEKNILKTIQPLFLDDLRDEFQRYKDDRSTQRKSRLNDLHKRLGTLTFFDPACGCGNFLILAYRELRLLELDILNELYPKDKNGYREGLLDVDHLSKIDVDQFYGIELNEFPVRVAETAMYLVDHQMNMKLGDMFGKAYARLPLQKSAKIHHGNALEIPWSDVISPDKCSYILGNPPFIGKSMREAPQTADIERVFHNVKNAKELDYVSCWFFKASQYIQNTKCKVALVSTNSITQGEQVSILWQHLLDHYNIKLHFAHHTFKWTIDEQKAKGMKVAAVYCVIIGFASYDIDTKYLYEYETIKSDPIKVRVKNINPYLIDSDNIIIPSRTKPICDVPPMKYGSKPVDGGHLLFKPEEKDEFIKLEPNAKDLFKPCLSADEYLNGKMRYCLWLKDANLAQIQKMPKVMERINQVKAFRLASPKKQTNEASTRAWEFAEIRQPEHSFVIIPRTTSEFREYIPFGFFDADYIVTDTCQALPEASMYHFAIITSKMHMSWVKVVAGRLEGRFRYSNLLVYNNFPWPEVTDKQEQAIAEKAKAVLDARANHPESTLAELYNPTLMPVDLRKAHNELDKAVDRAYRSKPFENELERIQFLFERYQALAEPLTAEMNKKPKRKRKTG